jgi:hypothetical protein
LKTTFFLLLLNKRRKSRDLDAMSLSANFMRWSSSIASTVSRRRGDILDMRMLFNSENVLFVLPDTARKASCKKAMPEEICQKSLIEYGFEAALIAGITLIAFDRRGDRAIGTEKER